MAYTTPFVPREVTSVRWTPFSEPAILNRVRFTANTTAGLYIYQQIYFDPSAPPELPLTVDFTPNQNWNRSFELGTGGIVMALSDCDATGLCAARYLSQGGTATWTALGDDLTGRMAGRGTNVRLVEWDFQFFDGGVVADQPVANARCIDVSMFSYDLTYTATTDGGALRFDAGM
jgi:hypothetical protein